PEVPVPEPAVDHLGDVVVELLELGRGQVEEVLGAGRGPDPFLGVAVAGVAPGPVAAGLPVLDQPAEGLGGQLGLPVTRRAGQLQALAGDPPRPGPALAAAGLLHEAVPGQLA